MKENKKYVCTHCKANYTCRQSLFQHMLNICHQDPSSKKIFICHLCNKDFDRKDNMVRHVKICEKKMKTMEFK